MLSHKYKGKKKVAWYKNVIVDFTNEKTVDIELAHYICS